MKEGMRLMTSFVALHLICGRAPDKKKHVQWIGAASNCQSEVYARRLCYIALNVCAKAAHKRVHIK